MIDELIKLMIDQEKDLQTLFELLKVQCDMAVKKDLFGLEGLVDKLIGVSKEIAKEELQRRQLLGEMKLSEVVANSDNVELKKAYKKIGITLKTVMSQKETNEMILKQQLLFTNKMLAVINPDRRIKTYTSFGNLSR
ncbi:flagellar protein FlgN [Clostridium sp. BL-8]|uniref:flagellar protein FlgN n=1 Tax=Clostridium sp. BL-8 TaxID=349938 RepID=UPI00098CEBDE|nr:flagellar protein FlgN [Clostridium sp. BL-8]OOM79987.1 FlgN protein [Clostridium sp. BL-8]